MALQLMFPAAASARHWLPPAHATTPPSTPPHATPTDVKLTTVQTLFFEWQNWLCKKSHGCVMSQAAPEPTGATHVPPAHTDGGRHACVASHTAPTATNGAHAWFWQRSLGWQS